MERGDRTLPPPWDGTPRRWARGKGLEFDRVGAFNDAVFAIALTLLVLDLKLPELENPESVSQFISALGEIVPDLIGFAVAFMIVGQYWIAQHGFYGLLGAIDQRFLGLDVVYLAFVAIVPFPTSLISEYGENPMALVTFGAALAAVNVMATLLLVHAHRAGLMRRRLSPAGYRYALLASLAPLVVYLGTIPLAFVIGPLLTILTWMPLSAALRWLHARNRPDDEAYEPESAAQG